MTTQRASTSALIRLSLETKEQLEALKIHPRESYNDVIKRLLEFVYSDGLEDEAQTDLESFDTEMR